jgi:hypothetical protein
MTIPGQKTFVQIQQEIAQEILDVSSNADATTRPTLTQLKRIINDRHRMICTAWSWWWLYREDSFPTVANQTTPYYPGSEYQEIQWMAIPAQQRKIPWLSMSDFETMYPGRYASYGPTIPFNYIPAPPDTDQGLGYFLFPAANAVYTVTFGAKLRVTDMSADADVPLLPADWQDLLCNGAKADVLKFFGVDPSTPRFQSYMQPYNDRFQQAILEDQRTEENVWRFRSARVERAMSAATDYRQGVWMTDGNITSL